MAAKYEHKGGVLQSSARGLRRGVPEPRCNSFDEQKVGTDPTEFNLLTTILSNLLPGHLTSHVETIRKWVISHIYRKDFRYILTMCRNKEF
jgi:hypothetical protein